MRRGQAALEFLVTYGWAILIVIVMVGAMAYFGVFNPKDLAPDRCIIGPEFSCDDFYLAMPGDGHEVEIALTNAMGKTVELQRMVKWYEDQQGAEGPCTKYNPSPGMSSSGTTPYTLQAGATAYTACNYLGGSSIRFPAVGEKVRVTFAFNYTIDGGFPHRMEGEIIGTVQP